MKRRIQPSDDGYVQSYTTLDEALAYLKKFKGKGRIQFVVTFTYEERQYLQNRRVATKRRGVLIERYGAFCMDCGDCRALVVDHIVPLSRQGDSNVENLQLLCRKCNFKKGRQIIDYRPYPFDDRGVPCAWCETMTWALTPVHLGYSGMWQYLCPPCHEEHLEDAQAA